MKASLIIKERHSWSYYFLVWFLVLLGLSPATQAATYAYRTDVFSYDAPSGSATAVGWHTGTASPACTSYPNGDDDWADINFPAGFAFTFDSTVYSGVRVYSNGILAFGNDVSGFHRDYTSQSLPVTAAAGNVGGGCPNAVPVNLMLPYWIDIVAGTANGTSGASVKYELLGTAPNRRFVISWSNVILYGSTTRYNFQVVLYEGSAGVNGNFQYRYTSGSSTGANAAVGVQLSTTDYTQYSYNQQFIDTTNGTSILWYPANQLATKAAEYRFDEGAWIGTAGEIADTSGSSLDAQRLGNASNVSGGKLCRGGSFTNNTSNAVIDAVATPVVPGSTGSIGFWYKSNNSWNSADTMLFDATTTSNRPFFLMKRSTGALRFAIADSAGTTITANASNQSFTAGTWHHVGVTWSIRAGTNQTHLQVFIDGSIDADVRGTTNGTLAPVSSINIGDNRTSGVTPSNGTPNGANGIIDEFYIYPLEVSGTQFQADMALTRLVCSSLDHFHIVHGGASSCAPGQITIEAHDASHALFSLAGTTMTIAGSTAHGTWSAVTAINLVNNTTPGTATYTFANESSVVLALNNSYSESVNFNVTAGTFTERSGAAVTCSALDYTFGSVCDANLIFGACVSQFECLESSLGYNNLIASPAARNPLYTQLANTAFAVDVVAADVSGNRITTYAADANKTVTVELVNGSGGTACASRATLSPPISSALTFTKTNQPTEQGRKSASFTVNQAYPNVRCRVTDATRVPTVVACSSDSFAIRPPSFTVSANLGGATLKAGYGFAIAATSGYSGYAGLPKVDVTQMTDHAGNAIGLLTGSFTSNTGGTASGTFQYHDVGQINFGSAAVIEDATGTVFANVDVSASDCILGSASNTPNAGRIGCLIGSTAVGPFGRFYPDHFNYVATLTPAQNGFTYMNQPAFGIALSLEARSLNETVTSRYTAGYGTLGTFNITGDNTGTAVSVARLSPALPAFVWSGGRYTVTNASSSFTRTALPDGPYDSFALKASILSEPDGVAISGTSLSNTTRLRFGRLRLVNFIGSELLKPRVEYRAEYWDGNRWATNTLDTGASATSIVAGNITTGGLTLNALTGLNGGIGYLTFNTAAAGSYDIAFDLNASGVDTSCNAAHAGTPADKPWLQGHWTAPANCGGVAAWAQDPNARIRLGSPRAPYIYLREQY